MKTKRMMSVISLILSMILISSALIGCGSGSSSSAASSTAPAAEAESAAKEEEAPAEEAASASSEAAPAEEAEAAADVDYGPELKLRFGTSGAPEDISTQAAQYMCDLVAERSGGAITIDLFPNSQLGASVDQMEMLGQGSLDLFLEANLMGSFGINTGAMSPLFLTRSRDELAALMDSDVYAAWADEFTKSTNVKILTNNWFRNGTAIASKNKIEKLEDCSGVKLRVPPVASTTEMFNSLGFNATPVAYNETLISLQQGVIDAVWCTEDAIWTMGFYEPANYVLELNAGADSMYVYMNNDLYETGLTDAQRELIVQCAKDAGDYYSELTYDALATNRANWEAAGVETITLSPEEAERWAEITFAYAYKQEEEGVWEAGLFDKCREIVEATRAGS